MSTQLKRRYILEEYLEMERVSEERLEFWNGEISSMSGVNQEHAEIEVNIVSTLHSRLRGRECHVFPANMRIKGPSMPLYRYADVSALCDKAQFEKIGGVDALTNPSLIIEILSSSTEAYDRGEKFSHYQSILNFREYLLAMQHRPHVTQFIKQTDGAWRYREFNDLNDAVKLETLNCELRLSEIYENVESAPSAPLVERDEIR